MRGPGPRPHRPQGCSGFASIQTILCLWATYLSLFLFFFVLFLRGPSKGARPLWVRGPGPRPHRPQGCSGFASIHPLDNLCNNFCLAISSSICMVHFSVHPCIHKVFLKRRKFRKLIQINRSKFKKFMPFCLFQPLPYQSLPTRSMSIHFQF